MSEIINFRAKDKWGFDTQLKPVPANQLIPQWYKDAPAYEPTPNNPLGDKMEFIMRSVNSSFKKCTPMLDAIISGYIVQLWADVLVNKNIDNSPNISWITKQSIFTPHGDSSKRLPPPTGYSNYVAKYMCTWIPQTPPGYSCLISSPFGHRDLPFHAIPAIIDTDKNVMELSVPMWIKKDYEGLVEKGTPLIQITPFKRSNWKSTFDYYEDEEFEKLTERTFFATAINHYTKNIWSKKDYK
jgi:hypothetical protein